MSIAGFRRERAVEPQPVTLDVSQRAVLELPEGASAAVLGAPGTGKTTTLIELVAHLVHDRGWSPDELVALTSSRPTATRLRDTLAARLRVPTTGPIARTVNSLAFEVVGAAARAAGSTPPRLVTGGEQDADIAALIEGHIQEGTGPQWPAELPPEVRRTRRFRAELRDLMARATEHDVSPDQLAELGRLLRRPAWVAAAEFIREYLQVLALSSRDEQVDSAELARFAVAAIGAQTPVERIAALRLVLVDDLQDATEGTLSILRALAARGIAVIGFGDPDLASNAFRGGTADAVGRLGDVLGVPVERLVLAQDHRHGDVLRGLVARITARIGTASAGRQRAAVAAGPPGTIAVLEAPTAGRQWSAIARELRERHLLHGVAWDDLAVVVRSRAQVDLVRRALSHADVPVRTVAGGTSLRDDRAARALLDLVDVGIGRTPLTPATAVALLTGPFGGLDALGLRKLRIALRAEEVAGGGNRTSGELLVEALGDEARLATIDHRVGRAAARLAGTLAALRDSDGTIEELLWLAWERSGLARRWYDEALGSGVTAAEANRDLDGIVALFTAAKRFAERRPGDPPATFLAAVLDADVPEDTLSPQPRDAAVLVTTPAGVVGLGFDTVVVAGLQDGVWPNPRLRGSLFAPEELVREVTGVDSSAIDERKQVLSDELRLFALAVSRASSRVVLAAVANEDEAPSVLLSFAPSEHTEQLRADAPPLSLRSLTGRLRRRLSDRRTPPAEAQQAAQTLAALAERGVPGADPSDWHGLVPITTTGPLFDGQPVPISPSNIESVENSPLDWFLETIAGAPSGIHANVGTILHWAMETTTEPGVEALWAAVESRWNEIVFEAPWLAERQRRIARGFAEALAEYLDDFTAAGKRLAGSERRFELEVDNAIVRGSIDRVEVGPDGEVVIVDLKTGTPITKADDLAEHPQLLAYQLAYAEGVLAESLEEFGAHRSGGAKLLFVKSGVRQKKYREGVQEPLTPEQLEQFRERIRRAATVIAAAEFEGLLELPAYGNSNRARLQLNRVRAVSSD